MNNYQVTVLYAVHESEEAEFPEFPAQTLPQEAIQILQIRENDPWHTRQESLKRIPEAQGTYTIMLDHGDKFADVFLESMISFAEDSGTAFAMSTQVCKYVKRSTEFFSMRAPKGVSSFSVRSDEIPLVFPMELHGLLIPTQALQEAYFRTEGMPEREKQILLYLLRRNPEFTFVNSRRLTYIQPRECDHQYNISCLSHEWYTEPLSSFLLPLLEQESQSPDSVSVLAQYMALHMIHIRLFANRDNRNKHVVAPEELPEYVDLLSQILAYVSEEAILHRKVHPTNAPSAVRLMEIRLKYRDWSWFPELREEDEVLKLMCGEYEFNKLPSIPLRINLIDYRNGCLEMDGAYFDYFPSEGVEIYARLGADRIDPVYNQRYSLTKYFGQSFYRMKTFHISIPVPDSRKERLLNFYLCFNGREYPMEYGFPSHTSRYARDFTYGYWKFGKYLSFWNKEGIHVCRSNPLLVLRKEVFLWMQMWKVKKGKFRKQIPLKIVNFVLRPWFSRQRIWLFMDKIYKGGDSSEYIYRYASAQKDGIRKYYLLDKSSADYERMRNEGYRPLIRGSLKHRLVFLNANMVIASNSTVFAFNDYSFSKCLPIRGDTHFDVACVQHGMSVQKIAIAQQRLRDNTKLYFCASKYEIENLSHPAYDYAGYDALKLTGVPRYDGLKSRAEKILLFSPTWRMNSALPVTKNEGVARDYNPHFKETNYYKVYNSLMNDPRLLDAARQYGYRIQYVLHPIVSPQHEDFDRNELVEIIPSIGNMSYEKLFCEAALMVTDFSGVQFDFAYMRKPVVYLHHHDIPQHYEEGTFHYTTMGFGEICHSNDELIDVLCSYMKNDCQMPELYRQRADDFFAFSDNQNCARIYPIMLEHERNRENRK